MLHEIQEMLYEIYMDWFKGTRTWKDGEAINIALENLRIQMEQFRQVCRE